MKYLSVVILATLACYAMAGAVRFPTWPDEFKFNSAGPISGWACTRILESADPAGTWGDNYFCHKSGPNIRGVGMIWSSVGPPKNFNDLWCAYIVEKAEPLETTWLDNFLCVPRETPYKLEWSSAGPIKGKKCVQWFEAADPHTWKDNYLCA